MFGAPTTRDRSKWTVLIVEDDPDLGKLLVQYLTYRGFNARLEKDGYSALEHFSSPETSPDLVLTDVALPGMDGFDLLEAIKREHPEIPVVFLTGSDEISVLKAGERTPDAFLRKPMRLAELGEVVFGILNIDD